ncbi:MAG: response regulator [Verrucomicrobiota bacterium]|nr:response regulator [Verrucomicrobiota bacterium]
MILATREPENDKVSILLVDDNPEKLLAIESVLEKLGQNLVRAHSGEEALRLLLRKEFALILMDVNMPVMDGFETASMIRKRRSLEHIPIIFVTALSTTDSDVFKGYSFGAVDYVLTPIVPEILRTKVGVFIELWKQKKALSAQAESLRLLNESLTLRAQQLTQANQELESFCYTIAHDLRAPLRAMEGLTAALIEDYGGHIDETGQDYGKRIRGAAERMDQMIQELLAYSRITLQQIELQPLSLSTIIQDVLAQLDYDLRKKNASTHIKLTDPQVMGHGAMLTQVVANLLSNGIKFVPPGIPPEIKIWDERINGVVRLWIEDNGIGIAPEHQERIFRVFERLHDRDTYVGTGIGLAIVQKAIHRMEGKVGVKSELGQGSRFWLELKMAPEVPIENWAKKNGHKESVAAAT